MNGADRVVEPGTIPAGEAACAADAAPLQGPGPVLRAGVALCVDLDGTLVKSDTLLDTVLVVARQRPMELVHIPGWIAQGRAAFKRHLTELVALDVEYLPYNRPLLEYLRREYGEGRQIYLATAADRELAERIAAYLGIFAGVLASDGATNLAGGNKLAAFRAKFAGELLLHRKCAAGCGTAGGLRVADGGEPGPRAACGNEAYWDGGGGAV